MLPADAAVGKGEAQSMVSTNHTDEVQLREVFGRVLGSDMVAV